MQRQFIFLIAMATAATAMANPQVYRTVGEHGEVLFTDQALPGSTTVELNEFTPVQNSEAELDRVLEVARELESARLRREEQRTRDLEARRPVVVSNPTPVVEQRGIVSPFLFNRGLGFGPGFRRGFGFGPQSRRFNRRGGFGRGGFGRRGFSGGGRFADDAPVRRRVQTRASLGRR